MFSITRVHWIADSNSFPSARRLQVHTTGTERKTNYSKPSSGKLLLDFRKVDNQNKWNDIAKELYRLSGTRFLRKPKQCR